MKTPLNRIISFLLLAFITLALPMSCSDQGVDTPDKGKPKAGQEGLPSGVSRLWMNVPCDIANPENPYDEAGLLHNEKLALIESRCTKDMELAEVYKQADVVIHADYPIPNYSSEAFSTPILTALDNESLPRYIASLNMSREQQKEVSALLDIVFEYNAANLCDIISKIKRFEAGLLRLYGAKDMEYVLIASSVARYSLAYWDGRLQSDDSDGGRVKINWKKIFVAAADVVGAVGGAVAGSPTIIGAVAGGITGAIGASAGAGSVWNIFAN